MNAQNLSRHMMDSTWKNVDHLSDIKVEDHPIIDLQDTDLRKLIAVTLDPYVATKHEYDLRGDFNDCYLNIEEFSVKIKHENMVDSGLADPHQTVKAEIDENINYCYSHMDVKVEEHPVQVQIKQEIELPSKNTISDNTHNISCNSIDLSRNNIQCQHYISGVNNDNLKRHKSTHINEMTNQCSSCESCFSQIDHPVQHLVMHSGEKLYTCLHCEKYVSQKYHIVSELNIQTFQKSYESKQRLLHKTQRKHTEENSPYCSQCEKGFDQKKSLANYQSIYTGEKPCQCNHCEMCFTIESNITNQSMDSYCRVCGNEVKEMDCEPLSLISKQKGIFARMYPLLDFESESLVICLKYYCTSLTKKHHYKEYSWRNDGRSPKRRISIVLWDNEKHCPIYHKDGIPYRYSTSPTQRLHGGFRNAGEPLAGNEVKYPSMLDHSYKTGKN